MRIIFAIKRLEDMAGGAERVFLEISGALKARGHDLSVVTFDRKDSRSFYKIPEGISWTQLNLGDSSKKAKLLETIQRTVALRSYIKKSNPDIVVAFQHSMFVPASIACIGTKIPVVASEHIVPTHYERNKKEFALLLISTAFIKRMTVLSESIRAMYPVFVQKNMVAITNPVREITISAESRKSSKIILNVGRLDPQKDQKTLLRAFKIIKNEYPDWSLRILGEGACRAELESLVRELDLQDSVSLPGLSQKIEEEYERASIFALSSVYESFGLATAEAMGAGLPVIGFADCPGTNEIIQNNKNGILVSINPGESRAESLAAAIKELIQTPSLRASYGDFGRSYAQQFKLEKVTDQWELLLRDVVTSSEPSPTV